MKLIRACTFVSPWLTTVLTKDVPTLCSWSRVLFFREPNHGGVRRGALQCYVEGSCTSKGKVRNAGSSVKLHAGKGSAREIPSWHEGALDLTTLAAHLQQPPRRVPSKRGSRRSNYGDDMPAALIMFSSRDWNSIRRQGLVKQCRDC